MAFYSREVCDNVRAANDIVDVLSSYMNLERRGSRFFGLCPFHNEKTGSFCVTRDNQLYYCFGCHESGNVVNFLMKYENMEFPEAIEVLADRAGIKIESEKSSKSGNEKRKKREELLAVNKAAAEYYYKILREADGQKGMSYFTDRGLSGKILNSFGLGFTGQGSGKLHEHLKNLGFSDEIQKEAGLIRFDEKRGVSDQFFNRVIFPIMDQNRKVIGFGARVMGDGLPKYINSPETDIFKKKETLYGLFAARRSRRQGFILCEGYMDVISAHMAGFDNAIAALGTAMTEDHAKIISRLNKPVYICFDSDNAGKKAATRAYEILREYMVPTKLIDLTPYKDPDELISKMGAEEFEKRIQNADNALALIKKREYDDIDKNDPDEEASFIHGLYKSIAFYKDEATRESYIRRFSRDFNLDENVIRRGVNQVGNVMPAVKREYVPPKGSNIGINPKKALVASEARLLNYLIEDDFYEKCNSLIEKIDFVEESFQNIYEAIVNDKKNGVEIVKADLLNLSEDEELTKVLSEVFFNDEEISERVESASVKKTVLERVKKASLRRQDDNIDAKDTVALQKAMEISRETMDEINKIKF